MKLNFQGKWFFGVICLLILVWQGVEFFEQKGRLDFNVTDSKQVFCDDSKVALDPHSKIIPLGENDSAKKASSERIATPLPRFSQVYPLAKGSPQVGWNDADMRNPLDRLELLDTLSEEWLGGVPTMDGWYSRVRVVKTTYKSDLLRIVEDVEVKADTANYKVIRSRIQTAVDAKYVLVSSVHAGVLAQSKIQPIEVKNPHYVKVLVDSPELISSVPRMVSQLKALGIREFETDSVISACAQANDPMIANGIAWHLENLGLLPDHRAGSDISAPAAWDTQTDASSVLIAVIDSGIDSKDTELASSMFTFSKETIGDGIDDDQNGYVDDVLGYDFYNDDPNPEDDAGHGSICAALIGATGNNGYGSSGVAWKASILNCKFLNRSGLGNLSDAIDAIDYARKSKARILNLSWSYNSDAPLLAEALGRCDTEGIVIVCASGNSGSFAPVPVPASIDLPHLVAVAATTPSDTLASFSVVDPLRVDLAAPGVDLPVSLSFNPYDPGALAVYPSGTSFSAALVSASIALGLSEFPTQTSKQIIRRMLETVDPIPGGAAALSSGGRLNLAKMLGSPALGSQNDMFAQRRMLDDASGQWSGRNDSATVEDLDLSLNLSPLPQRTTWFEWTASADGRLRVSAKANDGSAVRLAVFHHGNVVPGGMIGQSSSGDVIEIPVVAGQKMLWMLDSVSPIGQGLTLTWQLPPTNDNWLTAKVASGLPLSLNGNSLGSTVESFELTATNYPWLPNGSVWWKWSPLISQTIFLSPTPGHIAVLLPVKDGQPSFLLPPDYTNTYEVKLGESYAVLVIPVSAAAAGKFTVALNAITDMTIMKQPASALALAGEIVELDVIVASAGSLSYQWFRNGESIPFATSSKLKLSPIVAQSFGSYHVVVSNENSSLVSSLALVSPRLVKPRLISQTSNLSVVLRQSVDLNATFRSNSEMSYEWQKNGVIIPNVTTTTLIIQDVKANDAGTYSLTATNSEGSSVATIQVDIFETPWNGWVDRTPGMVGRGAIIDVAMSGLNADAFTATEWMNSKDGGQSWTTSRFPSGFLASRCASNSNGTVIVTGYQVSISGRMTSQVWKKTSNTQWQSIQPVTDQNIGTNTADQSLDSVFFFDGKWWALFYSNYQLNPASSNDGINWTMLKDPSDPTRLMRALSMFKFEDRLGINYWASSSRATIQLQIPGGGVKVYDFLNQDVRGIARIGDTCYHRWFNKFLKNKDSQMQPLEFSMDGGFSANDIFEGIQNGEFFAGLELDVNSTGRGSGELRQGVHETVSSTKSIGFSCFVKSNNRWLVGYPDGRLWSGTDLNQLPVYNRYSLESLPNYSLKALDNEFLYKDYQSSDGSKWQDLGAANVITSIVRPQAWAGDNFLHVLSNGVNNSPQSLLSKSIFPKVATSNVSIQNEYFSGENSILNHGTNMDSPFLDVIRSQSNAFSTSRSTLAIDWRKIRFAKQINGRWFLRTQQDSGPSRFAKTSVDGISWVDTPILNSSTIGKKNTKIIAIESQSRGYFSTNGTGWTPFVPNGLPLGAPNSIVAYRDYYVAQYGVGIYASADGVTWVASPAPYPIDYIQENRHTMLAVTQGGLILQPAGEVDSGPTLTLPKSLQRSTVSRNQSFKYEVEAEDTDGDLLQVECLQDGISNGVLTSPPFIFSMNTSTPKDSAVEFIAKDSAGRVSRVTAILTISNGGVPQSDLRQIDYNLSTAVLYKDNYYRVISDRSNSQSAVYVWVSGNSWRAISPVNYIPVAIVTNGKALVVSTLEGIITTVDGLNWNFQGGFNVAYNQAPSLSVKDGLFYLNDSRINWVSENGSDWSRTDFSTFKGAVWADSSYGISGEHGFGHRVTTDGGRNWVTIDKTVPYGKTFPLPNGFIVISNQNMFRIQRGEARFTEIFKENIPTGPYLPWLYAEKIDGVLYIGKVGNYLRSTTDGVNFSLHALPPNQNIIQFRRFNNEFLSISSDMICATKDLKSWRTIIDFRSPNNDAEYLEKFNKLKVSQYGVDGAILIENDYLLPDFILNADFSITNLALDTYLNQYPTNLIGGMRFKNTTIALASDWSYIRSDIDGKWKRVALYPTDGFIQPYRHSWPNYNESRYAPSDLFAATDSRFIMLKKDLFNPSLNYVISSEDGEAFKIRSWSGPIPLAEVTKIGASRTMFLAATNNGKVLRSTNGFDWTIHSVSPNLEILTVLFYGGKWHIGAKQGFDDEIWSSTDGISWSRVVKVAGRDYSAGQSRSSFIAQGIGRIGLGQSGWYRSTDGSTWQADTILNQRIQNNWFEPKGEHPLGIIGGDGYTVYVVDGVTSDMVRRVNIVGEKLTWLNGVAFLASPGRLAEWTESDPRLTSIKSNSGVYGVGDSLEIRISASELPSESNRIKFLLTTDLKIGNDDDIVLGMPKWSDGFVEVGGGRRFTVPLPQSVTPGQFKVAAKLELIDLFNDFAIQNNQIMTDKSLVEIPGYQLRLTTNGQGKVNTSDARPLYPQGARLQLEAIPQTGYTFRGWEGSLVSSQSTISVVMDNDKQLALTFSQGNRALVRKIGNGSISGAPSMSVMLPGESIRLSQKAASGWKFMEWKINGRSQTGATLSFQPTTDSTIEGRFVPDFEVWRARAFPNASSGINQAWDADPDGDGLNNWQEILLSSNPTDRKSIGQLIDYQGERIRLVFKRPQSLANAPWIKPESTENFMQWKPSDSSTLTERILSTVDGIETVEVVLPITRGQSRFFRLQMPDQPANP